MNLKNTIFILVIVVFLLQMMVLKQDAQIISKNSSKASIALSNFPLYDVAKNIAKDKLTSYMILPAGVDIHSFEPSPKDIVKLQRSSLVIYSGASLEPWITKLKFKNKTIDMSKYVDLIELDKHSHHHGLDPHYWLSIANMIKITKQITGAIIDLDIKNKEFYLENEKQYLRKLKKLDKLYKDSLSTCTKKEILTNHNAFAYLAKSYDFEIHSLHDISPDAQVDAKSMISLIKRINEHNISTIFYENFASSKALESVAKESNVKVQVLQPLANLTSDEEKENFSYEDIMKQNLSKLKEAMDCR